MSAGEYVLAQFGGTAVLLLLLGWLARSFGAQLLNKDLERYKAQLSAAAVSSTENLKHQLQIAAMERQVVFTKLQERRAEVLRELFSKLVEAKWEAESMASLFQATGEPSREQKTVSAYNKLVEFFREWERNRIYLTPELSSQLEAFGREMRRRVIMVQGYLDVALESAPAHVAKEKREIDLEAWGYFTEQAPETLHAIEDEFRKLLGASAPAS